MDQAWRSCVNGYVGGLAGVGLVAVALACSCDAGQTSAKTGAGGGTSSSAGTGGTEPGATTGTGGTTPGTSTSTSTSSSSGTGPGTVGSVCNFSTPVTLPAAGADGYVTVPPNDPAIYYFGRVDCTNSAGPTFAYPGVTIRMAFTGTGVDMVLKDQGTAEVPNFYDVRIDGSLVDFPATRTASAAATCPVSPNSDTTCTITENPAPLMTTAATQTYQLARGLAAGSHTVEVFKRIESSPNGNSIGEATFLGYRIPTGGTVSAPATRAHTIEFIGDSITCGYGDMDSFNTASATPTGYTTFKSNADEAYGAVTARDLNAELMQVSYSGLGMALNNCFDPAGTPTLPARYDSILPDAPSGAQWSFQWQPEVVVINLGTNDWSNMSPTGCGGCTTFPSGTLDQATYQSTYVTFLQHLRSKYPSALLLLASTPMLTDGYPSGESCWTSEDHDLQTVISTYSSAHNDTNIDVVAIPSQASPVGEDYHPTVATHQAMAQTVEAVIKKHLSW